MKYDDKMKDIFLNKRRLLNIFIYFLGIFALKGASLILTPLYTHVFSTAEYGSIELANSVYGFLSNIIGLGLCQYLGIEYFHFKNQERTIAIEKNIVIYFLLATPVLVLICLISVFDVVNISGLDSKFILLIGLSSYFMYFSNLCLMLCKNQQKTTQMTVIQLTIGLLTLALNYLGVKVLRWNIYSTLTTATVTNFIFVLIIPAIYKFDVGIKDVFPHKKEIKTILYISIPLAITGLVNSVLIMGDRWILNYYCSTSEIGIYSLATKIGSVFELILINTLTVFYAPHIYKNFQDIGTKEAEKKNRKMFWMYILISFIFAIGFISMIKWVFPLLIDNRYKESERYLWIVLIGDIFIGATYFRTYLINYLKRTKIILVLNVAAMVFNIILNLIFIPKFQIWAAAGTTAGSYVLMYVLAKYYNSKFFAEADVKKDV